MKRKALALAATLVVVACYEFTGPEPAPELLLTGTWAYELGTVPSGGYADTISMNAVCGRITGTGREYSLGSTSSFTITGWYSDSSRFFSFTFGFPKGRTEVFEGYVRGADSLDAGIVASQLGDVGLDVFYRLPVPPCADSAPLLGSYNPAAPGYLVSFQNSVDPAAEAGRLAGRYGFVVDIVYQAGPKGFAAKFSPATAAVLRCEPAVTAIEYDGIVTTQ